jgi:hypothetical protein
VKTVVFPPPHGRLDGMTKGALSKAMHRTPFQPFVLRLADGRAVRVPHQDFISMHPTGRTVIVYAQNEDLEIHDMMLVTGLQLPGKASKRRQL